MPGRGDGLEPAMVSTASALARPSDPAADPDDGVDNGVSPLHVPAPREPEMARVVARHNVGVEPGTLVPGPPQPVGDEIGIDDKGVVTWTPENPTSWWGNQANGTAVAIGTKGANGWINIDPRLGGGRMLDTALEALADGQTFGPAEKLLAPDQQKLGAAGFDKLLAATLEPAKSPFEVVPGSKDIALFLDGTSNWRDHSTNVSDLYDKFQGTKFYYGGVGNETEYARVDQSTLGGGMGKDFDAIVGRAMEDLKANWKPGTNVHVYGFSRGSAEAVELARRLGAAGIEYDGEQKAVPVETLGLFDPVYSVGHPGQDSQFVRSTAAGRAGNYVEVDLPTNVRHANVLYAQHEERSWFPATRLIKQPGDDADLQTAVVPGVHSDGGGHKDNNQHIAMLARTWMANANGDADRFGGAFDLSGQQLAEATRNGGETTWKFGGYGVQGDHAFNYAWALDAAISLPGRGSRQSFEARYPRDLSWAGPSIIDDPGLQERFAHPRGEVEQRWASERK